MTDAVDAEIDAIKIVLKALAALDVQVQQSVLTYVVKRLQINFRAGDQQTELQSKDSDVKMASGTVHIKNFKEQKRPKSANEMAALVAYYLANLGPINERKTSITAKDIDTYFKIADFPLPGKIAMTLPNAKAAGYLDASGEGVYKLNAVGHNLIAHSLPRGSGQSKRATKKPSRSKAR